MSGFRRNGSTVSVMFLAIAGCSLPASAQVVFFGAPARAAGANAADWNVDEVMIEVERALDETFSRLEASQRNRTALAVDEIDAVCKLTPEQRARLELAAKGLAFKKAQFLHANLMRSMRMSIERYHQMGQSKSMVMQFVRQMSGPNRMNMMSMPSQRSAVSYDRFWNRTLEKTLDKGQYGRYKMADKARRERMHEAMTDVVTAWTANQLRLSDDQIRELRKIFYRKITSTYWYRQASAPEPNNFYFNFQPLDLLGQVPNSKMKSILRPRQWKVYERLRKRHNNGMGMAVAIAEEDEEDEDADEDAEEGAVKEKDDAAAELGKRTEAMIELRAAKTTKKSAKKPAKAKKKTADEKARPKDVKPAAKAQREEPPGDDPFD